MLDHYLAALGRRRWRGRRRSGSGVVVATAPVVLGAQGGHRGTRREEAEAMEVVACSIASRDDGAARTDARWLQQASNEDGRDAPAAEKNSREGQGGAPRRGEGREG